MPRVLDPRFALILAYMDGAGSNLERAAARENAEAVARECGFTYAEALAELRGKPSSSVIIEPEPAEPAPKPDPSHPSTARDERIAAALAVDQTRSDRDVARLVGCSPTHVGRIRAAAGLARTVRIVRRGAQAYEMRIAGAPAAQGGMS